MARDFPQPMIAAAKPKVVLLDSVRGWAALSVLVFHTFTHSHLPQFPGRDLFYYFQADRAAVLVFFVLSGYVIGLTNQGAWSPAAARVYGWRRFVRIYPIYVIAILLGWAAAAHTAPGTLLGQFAFLQDSNITNPIAVPNLPGNEPLWSLHYEAFYYLCFLLWWRWPATVLPSLAGAVLAAFVATGWAPAPAVIITHAVGAVFWLAGLVLSRLPAADDPSPEGGIAAHILWLHSVYHFAPAYLLQRGLGIPNDYKAYLPIHDFVFLPSAVGAIALAGGRRLPFARLWQAAAAGCAAAGLAMILYAHKNPLETRWAFSTFYLLAGAGLLLVSRPLGLGRLAAVGAFSYALYVVHMPILNLAGQLLPARAGAVAGLASVGLTLAVIFPLAWWLETRFQPKVRSWLSPRN